MASSLIHVIAAVVSRGDELLVCQRPFEKRHGGLWEFPGGKCEQDESLEDAARRELSEELGVEVVVVGEPEFIVQDLGSPYIIAFTPVQIVGEPICKEHVQLTWGTPTDLSRLPLAPCDKQFLEKRLAR